MDELRVRAIVELALVELYTKLQKQGSQIMHVRQRMKDIEDRAKEIDDMMRDLADEMKAREP